MKNSRLLVLLFSVLLAAGCGKKAGTAAAPAAAAPAAASASGPLTVEITANDQMKFSVTRIEAKAGQEIKVVLVNIGSMPKAAMGHNWILLKKGVNAQAFVNAAVMAMANDYFPADKAGEVIAHTKMLGPKQTDEVTFSAPSEPGEYDFICSFPAHFVAGMKGVLVVK
jgi:azurin